MKSDLVYLRHIMDSILKVESYAAVGKDEFMTVPHWQDAIIRNLEIIGEATKPGCSFVLRKNHFNSQIMCLPCPGLCCESCK